MRAVAPAGSELSIVRNGRVVTTTSASELRHVVTGGVGAYRVEILAPGAHGLPPMPWLVSNPIYFGEGADTAMVPPAGQTVASATRIPPFPWRIEKDPASSATLRTGEHEASLEYKLGEGERNNQFVALATDLQATSLTAIQLSLAADRPMRASVQLRTPDGRRWGRSSYVDPAGSDLHIPVSSLVPIIGTPPGAFTVRDARSLLVVIDLTNAQPGRSGVLRVRSSALIQ